MPGAAIPRYLNSCGKVMVRIVGEPGLRVEIGMWIALVAVVVGIRAYLAALMPFVIWSDDAGSYAGPAARWLTTGVWVTDGRRGATYSLMIAGCMKLFGTVDSLMVVQHVMGAVAVILGMVVLRLMWGRAALLPLAASGYAYAVYALPISLEHLVRNETVLFFFSSVALASWFLAIHFRAAWWYLPAGLAGAITALTKSVFAPFPFLVLGVIVILGRKSPGRALAQAVLFAVGLALPHLGVRLLDRASPWREPLQPQSGILLFGRTAQFTKLDGGIEPELKALIRPDIESYRQLPKLDNNVIVNRTAVPRLRKILEERGQTPTDLNRLCQALAVEAIKANKLAYMRQVLSDCLQLHLSTGEDSGAPKYKSLATLEALLEKRDSSTSLVDTPATLAKLRARADRDMLALYHRWTGTAWLFRNAPVLLTSMLLPWLVWWQTGDRRWWWIGCAGLWFFTVVLLCTVGRPMDRYLLPAVPVMFWTIGSAVAVGWQALAAAVRSRAETSPKSFPDRRSSAAL